jgi:hypothetical protein
VYIMKEIKKQLKEDVGKCRLDGCSNRKEVQELVQFIKTDARQAGSRVFV